MSSLKVQSLDSTEPGEEMNETREFTEGCQVRLTGIQNQPDLNGCSGRIVKGNFPPNIHVVALDNGKTFAVPEEKLDFATKQDPSAKHHFPAPKHRYTGSNHAYLANQNCPPSALLANQSYQPSAPYHAMQIAPYHAMQISNEPEFHSKFKKLKLPQFISEFENEGYAMHHFPQITDEDLKALGLGKGHIIIFREEFGGPVSAPTNETTKTVIKTLESVLKKLGLGNFIGKFEEDGYELAHLYDISDEELYDLGMGKGHAKDFRTEFKGPNSGPNNAPSNATGNATEVEQEVELTPRRMKAVTKALSELNMDQFVGKFKELGFDDVSIFPSMTEEHFKDIGLGAGHKIKFRRKFQPAQN